MSSVEPPADATSGGSATATEAKPEPEQQQATEETKEEPKEEAKEGQRPSEVEMGSLKKSESADVANADAALTREDSFSISIELSSTGSSVVDSSFRPPIDSSKSKGEEDADVKEKESSGPLVAANNATDADEGVGEGNGADTTPMLKSKDDKKEEEKTASITPDGVKPIVKKKRKKQPTSIEGERGALFEDLGSSTLAQSCKHFISLFWVLLMVTLFITWLGAHSTVHTWVRDLADWTDQNQAATGVVAFIFAFVDSAVLLVSTADMLLSMACGWLWGVWAGAALSFASGLMGALLSRYLARRLLRPHFFALGSRFRTFRLGDRALKDYGYLLVFALRLCPYLPMGISSYMLGVSDVSLEQFVFGHFGALPSQLLLAKAGANQKWTEDLTHAALRDENYWDTASWLLLAAFAAFSITVVALAAIRFVELDKGKMLGDSETELMDKMFKFGSKYVGGARLRLAGDGGGDGNGEGVPDEESVSVEVDDTTAANTPKMANATPTTTPTAADSSTATGNVEDDSDAEAGETKTLEEAGDEDKEEEDVEEDAKKAEESEGSSEEEMADGNFDETDFGLVAFDLFGDKKKKYTRKGIKRKGEDKTTRDLLLGQWDPYPNADKSVAPTRRRSSVRAPLRSSLAASSYK